MDHEVTPSAVEVPRHLTARNADLAGTAPDAVACGEGSCY
jgi:hypothetical protein